MITPSALEPATDKPPQVPIVLDDAIPTDETIDRDLVEMGMIRVSAARMKAYSRLGHKLEGNGVIRTVRGYAFASHSRLESAVAVLSDLLEKKALRPKEGEPQITVEEACSLTHEIAYATSKLTEVENTILGMQPKVFTPVETPQPHMPIFPATTAVMAQSGSHVHLHQPEVKK